MKINEAQGLPTPLQGIPGRDERKVQSTGSNSFQNQLNRFEDQTQDEKIKQLVDEITRQGEKVGKKVDVRDLKIYKQLISEFLEEAVGGSRKFSKRNLLDRRGRHKSYALIKLINGELEQLTKDVLSSERDNIAILKRIEDIRGLILDLFL